MLAEVEAFALDFFGDAQAGEQLGDEHRDGGSHAGPADRDQYADDLGDNLICEPEPENGS